MKAGVAAGSGSKAVLGFGIAMVVLGVAAYVLTGFASVTALIPAFVGVPVALLGLAAAKFGKAAVIAAGVLGLLGMGGPLARLVLQITGGEFVLDTATAVQIVFVLLAAGLVIAVGVALVGGSRDDES